MPVKSVIDDHIQRLFDALLNSLRRAIEKETKDIETFLNSSMETLSKRPQSTEEIAEANTKHAEFAKQRRAVSEGFVDLEETVCSNVRVVIFSC